MRIDKLHIKNFKGFADQKFALHPQFSLFVGDNGTGKTSILDALAVTVSVWKNVIGTFSANAIAPDDVHSIAVLAGDRIVFENQYPVKISVNARIDEHSCRWSSGIDREGGSVTLESYEVVNRLKQLIARTDKRERPLPVIAYYNAHRAWISPSEREDTPPSLSKPMQYDAYRDCLNNPISVKRLNDWFLYESAVGADRPGFVAIKKAILGCIPEAQAIRYDPDYKQIVISIGGKEQPFFNLSDGQRSMLALIADIAIKAVTLNSYLLGPDQPGAKDPSQVLKQTPGIVLIDELDVHLHPKWQRRVANDLKKTFPSIQFVCTSHSPQIIGELPPEQIVMLADDRVVSVEHSFGLDSNRVLEEMMDAPARNETVNAVLKDLFRLIDDENFPAAKIKLDEAKALLGSNDPEITRASTLMNFLEEAL